MLQTLGIMDLPSCLQAKRVHVVIHTACVGDLDPPTQHPGWFGTRGHEAACHMPDAPMVLGDRTCKDEL